MSRAQTGVVGAAVVLAVLVVVVVVVVVRPFSHDEDAARLRTVFVGDSITQADSASYDESPGAGSWVRYAVADDRSPWTFEANVAVAGQTLAELAERFERDVLSRDPQAVVIMGGTNDVLRGLPMAASLASLRSMVEQARHAGARVWIIGPPPINALHLKPVGPMAAAQSAVARETGATYVDLTGTLVGPDGDWLAGLTYDGIHPTPVGAEALASAVLDGLE